MPALLLTAVLGFGDAATAKPAATPEDTVRDTANQVVAVLADDRLSLAEKTDRLESYLDSGVDFETTAKLVLGRNWREFTEQQRGEFVKLFRRYLIATYGNNIDSYQGETVNIVSGREEARGDYTVYTKIDGPAGGANFLVDYRLRKTEDGLWRIIDVVAEGISMVSNLRSQFQEVVSRGGAESLLRKLREKIAEGFQPEATNQPAAAES